MHSVFHPTKKNPFRVEPLPQTHYAPSPSKDTLDKSISLTPQKLKHRYQYSLPPEVYTPEQYSIHEEESCNKPPLPKPGNDDMVWNLSQILNDVETWDSAKFCEKWSSRVSEVKENCESQESTFQKLSSVGPLSSTIKRESTKPATRPMKEKPTRIQTSFASDMTSSEDHDRTSNIQERLNRFRYGAPKAPNKRNREKSKLSSAKNGSIDQPSSYGRRLISPSKQPKGKSPSPVKENRTTNQRHARNIPAHEKSPRSTETGPKPPLPPPVAESPELVDTSLSTLNSRLDRLIQESSSVALSPISTLKSSVDQSTSSMLKVSSDSTTLSSQFASSHPDPIKSDPDPPRRMRWQKENALHSKADQNLGQSRANDILHQWRLKRKLEEVREHVEKNQGIPSNGLDSYNKVERPFAAEASKVLQDSTSLLGVCSNPSTPRKQNNAFTHLTHRQPPWGCPYAHQLHQVTPQFVQSRSPGKRDAAVSATEMVSIETQTGSSLILSGGDDPPTSKHEGGKYVGNMARATTSNTFPHTSTPASTVSFHRVKIVEAEPNNSPQAKKDPSQMPNFSPVSSKTDATTLWSSADHKRTEESQSPMSSVPSSCQRNISDAEPCSPTAKIVKQVIGSRLFNTTPSSTGALSRSKNTSVRDERKKMKKDRQENLNGSYTGSDTSKAANLQSESGGTAASRINEQASETSVKSPISCKSSNLEEMPVNSTEDVADMPRVPMKAPSNKPPTCTENIDDVSTPTGFAEDYESVFDPSDFFDEILRGVEGDEAECVNKEILQEIRKEKNHILEEFRLISAEIERPEPEEL